MCFKDPKIRFLVAVIIIIVGLLSFGLGQKLIGILMLIAWWIIALVGYIKARPEKLSPMMVPKRRIVKRKVKKKAAKKKVKRKVKKKAAKKKVKRKVKKKAAKKKVKKKAKKRARRR